MAFIVPGLIWRWILHTRLGIQSTVRGWGWDDLVFDLIERNVKAIYVVVLAGI